MTTSIDPADEYKARLTARFAAAEALSRRDRMFSLARTIVFFGGLVTAWAAFHRQALSSQWVWVPVALFAILLVVHHQVVRARRLAERSIGHYRLALDRLEGRWMGRGEAGTRYLSPEHPYAADLDLFGSGSLFELLCMVRTCVGERTLADWLLHPAGVEEVRARQEAVRELTPHVDLRETLSLLGEDLRKEVPEEAALKQWGQGTPLFPDGLSWLRVALFLLGLVAVGTTIAGLLGHARRWMLGCFALELSIYLLTHHRIVAAAAAVQQTQRELGVIAAVLERVEREPMSSPKLTALRAAILSGSDSAAKRIGQLANLGDLLSTQQNLLFRPLALLLMWPLQLAWAIEVWRARYGQAIAGWLDATGAIEALTALGGYAFEHPNDVFPEFVDGAVFDGEGLGHPLLPEAHCVRNDVRLSRPSELSAPQVLLVSGSNMSGKSTLLRTIGIHVVLAFSGAPVRATRLSLSRLQVGAALRVQDSLRDGVSRFYAEIKRLRQIVDLTSAGSPDAPVLFLLDELLAGTNSHDRRIGAEAIVRSLVERGALGLVTTHDLALVELVGALGAAAANVHFEDHLEGGRLAFDYKMRPGTVTRSNALALMRSVGLEV